MGKSNTSKKVSNEVLRKFVKERSRWKLYAILSAVLFVLCCIFASQDMSAYGWIAVLALVIYIICMFTFRIKSQCPSCGKAIMNDFNKLTHCPYCKRPIKEQTVGKSSRDLLKKR